MADSKVDLSELPLVGLSVENLADLMVGSKVVTMVVLKAAS